MPTPAIAQTPTSTPSLADVLTRIHQDQLAVAAGLEEVAKWIAGRGNVDVQGHVQDLLTTLDGNAEAIEAGIGALVSSSAGQGSN